MDSSIAFQAVAILILIALSSFFSSAETAMTTVNKIRIQSLAEQGNKRAVILEKIISNSPKMLSTVLIGNNIVNTRVRTIEPVGILFSEYYFYLAAFIEGIVHSEL